MPIFTKTKNCLLLLLRLTLASHLVTSERKEAMGWNSRPLDSGVNIRGSTGALEVKGVYVFSDFCRCKGSWCRTDVEETNGIFSVAPKWGAGEGTKFRLTPPSDSSWGFEDESGSVRGFRSVQKKDSELLFGVSVLENLRIGASLQAEGLLSAEGSVESFELALGSFFRSTSRPACLGAPL